MLKKLKLGLVALLLPLLAFAQSYPSPTFNNLTVLGTFTSSGNIGLPSLAAQAANTVVANATASSASPTAFSMPSCSTSSSALGWTSGSGFACNTTINAATLGGATFASPPAAGYGSTTPEPVAATTITATTPIGVASGGTGRATLTLNSVLLGNGASGINSVGPNATTGLALISQGSSAAPVFGHPLGTLINVQVLTSSGTYTPTTGTNSIIVEVQGGGGAGGGAPSTSTGQQSGGCGGGSGGYAKSYLTSGFSGATVTIGAAGSASSGAAGGSGGNTSFGTITANGGAGGTIAAAFTGAVSPWGGDGGTASGGNVLNVSGQHGGAYVGATSPSFQTAPDGANSMLGTQGLASYQGNGTNGTGYGSGGGGSANGASQAVRTGGNGAQGVVIVWEFS